jgi:hypothetical protein
VLKSKLSLLSIVAMTLLLVGCDKTKEALGLTRTAPDEMQVIERPPLSMPPGYGLRPPASQQHKAQTDAKPRDDAETSVLGKGKAKKTKSSQDKSITESELLKKANVGATDPDIRDKIAKEVEDAKPSIGEQLAFWTDNKKPGQVIDPEEENEKHNGSQTPGQKPVKDTHED